MRCHQQRLQDATINYHLASSVTHGAYAADDDDKQSSLVETAILWGTAPRTLVSHKPAVGRTSSTTSIVLSSLEQGHRCKTR